MRKALELWFYSDHDRHADDVRRNKEFSKLRSELKENKAKLRQRGEKITVLREKVEGKNADITALKDKIRAKNEKITKLREKNSVLELRLSASEAELKRLREESLWQSVKRHFSGKK